jgi:hypothetical protein
MKEIKCPYCGVEMDLNHDDGQGYDENIIHTDYCSKCKKNFVYTTSISFDYYPEKADCLNGSEHDFKPTNTFPKFLTKMFCRQCGESRNPTTEEKELYSIPTYEQYLKESKITETK